ncbi:MAG: hypothetical protein KDD43_07735 [Bdellovibrionales bacterium]|nr:hypothetical protein [Bdellovibrionales bacterium]
MKRILLPVLVLSLVPYFILAFFSYPSTDDFAYANYVLDHGLWAAQGHVYTSWSGRYLATFLLSLNPVAQKWIWGFPLIPLVLLGGFWASLVYFCRKWTVNFLDRAQSLTVATLLFSLTISFMQIPVQAFYWLAGSVTYTFPLILTTLAAGLMVDLFRHGDLTKRQWLFVVLVGPIVVGCNETIMLQWMTGILIFQLFFFLQHRRLSRHLILGTLLSAVGSAVVFLAPGNSVRTSHFEDAHRPFYAIYRTVGASIEHFVQFLSPALILFSLLAIVWCLDNKDRLTKTLVAQVPTWIPRTLFALMLFSAFFPAMWAMGGNPPKRVDNTTYYWYLLFWFLNLIHWVHAKPEKFERLHSRWPNLFAPRVLLPLALVSLFLVGNHRHAFTDLAKASKFSSEWKERQVKSEQVAQANKGSSLVFSPLKNKPKIIFNEDLTPNPEEWHNMAWAQYFDLGSVRITQ